MELPVLQRTCEGCGVCCEAGDVHVPPYTEAEIHNLPRRLAAWVLAHVAAAAPRPWRRCLAFDPETRRCRIYEHRPGVCRTMPVGGEWCTEYRKLKGLPP